MTDAVTVITYPSGTVAGSDEPVQTTIISSESSGTTIRPPNSAGSLDVSVVNVATLAVHPTNVGTLAVHETSTLAHTTVFVGGASNVGPPGPQGAPGKDGQIRFTGHGPPTSIIGSSPGDTYMDLNTGDIYKLT